MQLLLKERYNNSFLRLLAIFFVPTSRLFWNIGEFEAKKYFADNRIANIIQLIVIIKGCFSGLLFFRTSRCKGEFPRD